MALQTFNLKTGEKISSTLVDSLFPYLIVAPERPPLVKIGRKMAGRATKLAAKRKRKGKETSGEVEEVVEPQEEGVAEEDLIEVDQEGNELVDSAKEEGGHAGSLKRGMSGWMDGKTVGLAISKIVLLGSRETGGILVIASGSVLLVILFKTIFIFAIR